MDYILQLDKSIFYILNTKLTTYFLDFFMPFITTKTNFVEVIIFAWLMFFIAGKGRDKKVLVIVIFIALMSDFTTDVLKNIIHRTRPCNALPDVRILVGCTKSFSFPSGHATNLFAVAAYLSYNYRRYSPLFFFMAVIIAYSRIYVGVHYPLDIAGGALVGGIGALLAIEADKRFSPAVALWFNKKFREKT
ncbi:MAG: phosphatase PAP2 family protein [Deltaproteobacteria bacterium]|nr:phosphatase PAP2 family protein [Deltaproteobacteria bacterium]